MSTEPTPYAEIGKRLLSARYELHLTQSDLAKAIGVSERTYQHYERGIRLIPTDVMIRLGLMFAVRADSILFGQGELVAQRPSVAGHVSAVPFGSDGSAAEAAAPYARATLASLPPDARAALMRYLLEIDAADRTAAAQAKSGRKRPRARRFKADLSPPKYQNPDSPQQIWRGRGTKPTWLRDALASGRQLSDFLTASGSEQPPGGGD